MGACSYIRDTGYFNKAVGYYADKYGVDFDEVAKYVRIAQRNGQIEKNKSTQKRKYRWFAVEYSIGNARNGGAYFEPLCAQYGYAKGVSAESVRKRLSKHDDFSSEYAPCHWFGRIEGFDTEEDAKRCSEQWQQEYKNRTSEPNTTEEEIDSFFAGLRNKLRETGIT